MHQCKFKNIAQQNGNFAKLCLECGELKLGYRSLLLTFCPQDFIGFVHNMELNFKLRSKENYPVHLKNILIPTPAEEVSLLLSLQDYQDFVDFLKLVENKLMINVMAKNAISRKNKYRLN